MDGMLITHRGVVYPSQCDQMGHMNVMYYVGKFDEATWQLFASIGITPTYIREKLRGVAAIRQQISYRRELRAGDLVTVRSGILEISPKQVRFYHEMCNDQTGDLTATTVINAVHLDLQTRRSIPFPAEIVAQAAGFTVNITPVV